MPNIALLTPDPAHAEYAPMWPVQAAILDHALALEDLSASRVPWTGEHDLSGFDLVLPLLAWGYHDAPALWREKLQSWTLQHIRLANPATVLGWNGDKSYLLDFAPRGAPVVPSLLAEAATQADLDAARARFGAVEIIAKPPVSAGAHGVARIPPSAPLPEDVTGQRLIFQPLMPAIAQDGEYSLFWFGGDYSHTVCKRPRTGDIRVQTQHGGVNAPADPPAAALDAARAALALVADPLLYARVDLVGDGAGGYALMELELIEPQLFLELAPDRGRAFARAVGKAAQG